MGHQRKLGSYGKNRIFWPKTEILGPKKGTHFWGFTMFWPRPNLAKNWYFWSIWARPCRLIRRPVGGSVGGCGSRAVSRKTPIYFILSPVNDKNLTASPFADFLCEERLACLKRRSGCCQKWHQMDHMSVIDKKLGLVSMQTL